MPAKCPLCFQKLDDTQKLTRACIRHRESEQFDCRGDWRNKILCPRSQAESMQPIQLGVFLRHIGCRAVNPFFSRSGTLTIPQHGSLEVNGAQVTVHHWMFGALRVLAELNRNVAEMWFPLPMFRAVNREFMDLPANHGVTLRFAGAQGSGKTMIASMALVPAGYHLHGGGNAQPEELIDNYVYAAPFNHLQPDNDFLRAILPLSIIRSQQNIPRWIQGTPITTVNVKAAFFRTPGGAFGTNPWRALLAYDTPGELNEYPAEYFTEPMDVGVVLLDVKELSHFEGNAGTGVTTARERLATICGRRKCLVLNKMDLVASGLSGTVLNVMQEIRAGRRPSQNIERDLLVGWLTAEQPTQVTQAEKDLAALLRTTDVFFIWTDDLDSTARGKLPHSYGIGNLVNWAFEKRHAAIGGR